MESLFFITFLILAVLLLLISFWLNKPMVAVFAGALLILLGVFSWSGVEINTGNSLVTNFTYNSSGVVVGQSLVNTDLFTTKKDTNTGMVCAIIGLAVLLAGVLEVYYGAVKGDLPMVEDGDEK